MAPISSISAAPKFTTKEQHDIYQSSTPADGSFVHDPVLHHLERDVWITLAPAVDGISTAQGDVYITEDALSFFIPSTSKGFSVPYPTLSLHAISRQPISAAAHPTAAAATASASSNNGATQERTCVYCQLDENEGADYDNLPEDELIETKELSIFPEDPQAVQTIYAALSKCAALHPSTDTQGSNLLNPNGDQDDSVFADSDNDPDFAALLRQANANSGGADPSSTEEFDTSITDRIESNLTPAGRVRGDFVTPSSRFNPY